MRYDIHFSFISFSNLSNTQVNINTIRSIYKNLISQFNLKLLLGVFIYSSVTIGGQKRGVFVLLPLL